MTQHILYKGTRKQRLVDMIIIPCGFFVVELAIKFRTKSLVLIADTLPLREQYLNLHTLSNMTAEGSTDGRPCRASRGVDVQ